MEAFPSLLGLEKKMGEGLPEDHGKTSIQTLVTCDFFLVSPGRQITRKKSHFWSKIWLRDSSAFQAKPATRV